MKYMYSAFYTPDVQGLSPQNKDSGKYDPQRRLSIMSRPGVLPKPRPL